MNREHFDEIHQKAEVWAEQLKANPSFTTSDVEELKSHLLDLYEELTINGLNKDEAFVVAASRLGVNSTLKSEFDEINMPIIQLRKAILILSGISLFFLLYFFLICSTRLLVIVLNEMIDDPYLRIGCIISYVISFQMIFLITTLLFNFSHEKIIKRLVKFQITPRIPILLFLGILTLAIIDQWFRLLISNIFKSGLYTSMNLYSIFDFSSYSFPLILIICFVILFRKYYISAAFREGVSISLGDLHHKNGGETKCNHTDLAHEIGPMIQLNLHLQELDQISLNEEEAITVAEMRMGKNAHHNCITTNHQENYIKNLMILLSGVLLYFLLHYLMFSSSRLLFSGLQYFTKDVSLNIKRTWLYIFTFQWVIVFFMARLYFLDKNIVQRLNRIHVRPSHTVWLFVATISLAIIDRSLFPISKKLIRIDSAELETKFYDIFIISGYTLPFILGACFLLLFYKYYYDHVRICQ